MLYTGTGIDGAVARKFAADTGTHLSLHDLSVKNLSATYDHFIDRKFITIIIVLSCSKSRVDLATIDVMHIDRLV